MKHHLFLLFLALACCSIAFLASPAFAEETATGAEAPNVAKAAPPACPTSTNNAMDPVLLSSCFIQIECDNGSIVSCSGNNTCSTGGTNNRCVICDGVNHGCCAKTCCEVCSDNLESCLSDCGGFAVCTRACQRMYNLCVNGCTGGCS